MRIKEERHEPVLWRDRVSEEVHDPVSWTDRVRHERRNPNRYVRVSMPFFATIEGEERPGLKISVGDFVIDGPVEDRGGRTVDADLHFPFEGFRLALSVVARVVSTNRAQTELEIVEIGDQQHELLRKLVSACISGTLVTLDGLLVSSDDELPREARASGHIDLASSRKRGLLGRGARYAALFVVVGGLFLIGGLAAYDRFFILDAPFAATTSPRIDIRAPGDGLFDDVSVQPGDRIARDAKIGTIANPQLNADLALARATLRYQESLAARISDVLDSNDRNAKEALIASFETGSSSDETDIVQLLTLEKRLEQLQSQNNLERARIAGMERRARANVLFSPCDCVVRWARGGSGETWVDEGETLYELIPSDPNELLVEALVPLKEVHRVQRAQRVRLEIPERSKVLYGRVVAINLEGEQRPRTGFPDWVRHDLSKATVLIAPEREPLDVGVGTLVKASFHGGVPVFEPLARLSRAVSRFLSSGAGRAWADSEAG